MKWNPVTNALAACAYIGAVVLFLCFITATHHDTPDTPLTGVAVLSLLVLSVATMAFLFFFEPLHLLIEHKYAEAQSYFLKTLGVFAVATVVALTVVSLQ